MAGELVKLARELKKAQSGHNPKLEARVEREDAGRFIVRADEKLTAFLELEAAIYALQRIGLTSGRDFFQTRRR